MNASHRSMILLCAILALFQSSLRAEDEFVEREEKVELTILAMGDSITAGGRGYPTYRQFLSPKLKELNVRFIGPNKGQHTLHAGFGGKDSSFLLSRLPGIYAAHSADWVFIHSGHNHFAKDKPVPLIVKNTESMIRFLHATNPKVVVFLAQVIPSGKLPKYGYLPELNRELAKLVEKLNAAGVRVVLVNQADGFDWETDTLDDKVHPNEQGAKKMAAKWLERVKVVLGS